MPLVCFLPADPTFFLVRFVGRFGAHILVFTVATIVCAIAAFNFLGYLFWIFYKHETKDPKFGFLEIICTIFYAFTLGSSGVVACVAVVLSIGQVLRPFSQNLNDVSRDKLLLEFRP